MTWEIDFLNWIQTDIANPVFDFFFKYFTQLGSTIAVVIVSAALLIPKRSRKIGIQIILSLVLGVIIGNLFLKNVIARTRPFTDPRALINAAHLLIKEPSDYSFPSGHTLATFNMALPLFYNKKKWGVLAILGAAMIAFSRMYLFVHYPTDILCGMFLALFTSLAVYGITEAFFRKHDFKILRTG